MPRRLPRPLPPARRWVVLLAALALPVAAPASDATEPPWAGLTYQGRVPPELGSTDRVSVEVAYFAGPAAPAPFLVEFLERLPVDGGLFSARLGRGRLLPEGGAVFDPVPAGQGEGVVPEGVDPEAVEVAFAVEGVPVGARQRLRALPAARSARSEREGTPAVAWIYDGRGEPVGRFHDGVPGRSDALVVYRPELRLSLVLSARNGELAASAPLLFADEHCAGPAFVPEEESGRIFAAADPRAEEVWVGTATPLLEPLRVAAVLDPVSGRCTPYEAVTDGLVAAVRLPAPVELPLPAPLSLGLGPR